MSTVTFRGSREGLRVTLAEGDWEGVYQELIAQLDRPAAQSFFRGARVLLETPHRALGIHELESLIALFAKYQMELVTVAGDAAAQKTLNRLRGEAESPPEHVEPAAPEPPNDVPQEAAAPEPLVIKRTLRSGQTIKHAGDVVVLGDVNPGAEIIAEGDVVVWGKLRGLVHAGASGNVNATVGALTLVPTQLRIGTLIARAPEEQRHRNAPAEIARVKNGRIVVEWWGRD